MTDTIDVAALVAELGELGTVKDWEPWYDHVMAVTAKAATALQSQADALTEAKRELAKAKQDVQIEHQFFLVEAEKHSEWLENYMRERTRATTAEASLATMREALEEIAHSAETHSHVIVIARAALAREGK